MKTIKLNNNSEIPILGFGTYQLTGDACTNAISDALDIGYRHFDTADRYSNHQCISKSLWSKHIPREQIFLTTKVWWDDLNKYDVIAIAEKSLIELKTDYIDILLIHWPNPEIDISNTIEGLTTLKEMGKIKGFGVSNFYESELTQALSISKEISVNQIEIHPSCFPESTIDFCNANDIAVTAYSPLAQGRDLVLPEIVNLSNKYDKSPAQIILSWLMSKGIIVIPKAQNPDYIKDNYNSTNLELENEDLAIIDTLNKDNKII